MSDIRLLGEYRQDSSGSSSPNRKLAFRFGKDVLLELSSIRVYADAKYSSE